MRFFFKTKPSTTAPQPGDILRATPSTPQALPKHSPQHHPSTTQQHPSTQQHHPAVRWSIVRHRLATSRNRLQKTFFQLFTQKSCISKA